METKLDCFIAVNQQNGGGTKNIDIGSIAENIPYELGWGTTLISVENPANHSGKINSVEIWASSNLSGVVVIIFNQVSPNVFTARSSQSIGNVIAGSKQIFEVDLNVEKDDCIGIYWSGGALGADDGILGLWYYPGNQANCNELEFYFSDEFNINLYGIGVGTTGEIFPRYKGADCSLLVDDNGSTGAGGTDFYGVRIPCQLDVVRNIIGTYFDVGQGIRIAITVDGEPVNDSLIGDITIAHNLNYISTFSFTLGSPKYSPLISPYYIAVNSVVIITAYVNGQAFKLFTGLVDETRTTYDGGYRLQINGRDYGKKLLDKTMTLISVQDSADKSYRGSIVKYLAGQADITNVNVPTGDKVTIDHSFQDQTIWDMVQKECAIEGWYVQFDENGIMKVQTRKIKSNKTSYPVADWEYGEDKFIQLGLETSDTGIINKVIILGAIFEEEIITINDLEVPPYEPVYDEQTTTINYSFGLGEVVTNWSYTDTNFKVTTSYLGVYFEHFDPFPKAQDYSFKVIKLNSDLTIMDVEIVFTGGVGLYYKTETWCKIHRYIQYTIPLTAIEKAFSITITIKTKEQTDGGKEQYEEENPNEEIISEIFYTQVKAIVTDTDSILSLYGWGECKPKNEGALEFPLAETVTQCKRIGENIILDSHRFTKQPDFEIAFNPKLIVGQTVELTDKKIGYNKDRYFVEEAIHTIGADAEGKMKARTRIGCVYYA